jgi:hypothetical protein
MESIAGKALDLHTELQRLGSKEELSPDCSNSSAASQAHTEELAARLDEMGRLAADLARMVDESKSKLNRLQESSMMARSAASLHREEWSKADFNASTSHIRQCSGSNLETLKYAPSVNSQSYAASIADTPATPALPSKSKGLSLLRTGSLRKKVSLSTWPRKSTVASTVPFPSEGTPDRSISSSQRTEDTSARDQQEALSPRFTSPRDTPPHRGSKLTRASSGRGRALSHFLTRYGSRHTRTNSVLKDGTQQEADQTARSSSTLYDQTGSSEGYHSNPGSSTKTKAKTTLSKHFSDDEGVVELGVNGASGQFKPRKSVNQDGIKSPLQQSRVSTKAARPMSRIYQSPSAAAVSPIVASRKPSMTGGKSMAIIASATTKSPVTNQKERTLSKMKSFSLGRSNMTSRREDQYQRTPAGSKVTRDRSTDQSSSRHQGDSSELSTNSSPLEPISPRAFQFPAMTPLRPAVGEDPPRHYQQRSRESSSQSPSVVNTSSTPGGGLWTRLFRANTNNNSSNSSSRFQSPRAS